jgi:hypothetical protein
MDTLVVLNAGGANAHRHAEMEKPSGGLEAAADITNPTAEQAHYLSSHRSS